MALPVDNRNGAGARPGNGCTRGLGLALQRAGPAAGAGHPLRARRPTAPQLTNAGVWKAPPILVSGASAYRGGEFLYQDFLYDDHGARAGAATRPTRAAAGDTFSKPNGTYTYPTDSAYANNAADFVELRVKPLADATAFRVTLNTLKDPSLVAVLDRDRRHAGRRRTPFPARRERERARRPVPDRAPAGTGMVGELVDATRAAGARSAADGDASTATRRQIEVRVPHAAWDPTGKVVRLAAGVGLWDKANDTLPAPAADRRRHPSRRRRHGRQPAGLLQRRVPLRRADAAGRRRRRHRPERRLVARQGPGRRARAPATSAPSTPTSTSASSPPSTNDESGVPQTRPDGPHPREPLRDRAGRRLLGDLLHRRQQHLPGRLPGPACSPTRSTSRASRCRAAATA